MQTKQQQVSSDMLKISESTEFDYWFSEMASKERNRRSYVNGQRYSERIIKGKTPLLRRKYSDLKLVYSGNRAMVEFKRK